MSGSVASLHADPWASRFDDLESLNAAATDAIVAALDAVRRKAGIDGAPAPIVALGPAGAGKTHLFRRLRRRLGPRALFVHVRPLVGAEMTPRFLLGQIVQQLAYTNYDLTQAEVLAGTALAVALGENPRRPGTCLTELRLRPPAERVRELGRAAGSIAKAHPDVDATYLERLLLLPFLPALVRTAALVWLAGREPYAAQAARLGVREPLPDSAVVAALRTLAVASAPAAPLLVVFDQLENLVDPGGDGSRVRAYGNLVAELVDSVRDLAVVQMCLNSEWKALESALSLAQRSRVSGRMVPVALPSPAECRDLLRLWISRLSHPDGPFPWPFTDAQLDAVCGAPGTTPRMLLAELERVLEGGEPSVGATSPPAADAASADDALEAAWDSCTKEARAGIDAADASGHGPEPARLLDGLACLAPFVPALGSVKVEAADRARAGTLRIELVHGATGRSCFAALSRLAGSSGEVLALRERWREWPPTWEKTRAQWQAFCAAPGRRWHWLDREDAVRLLALPELVKRVRSGDVSIDGRALPPDSAHPWIARRLDPAGWPIARALAGTEQASAGPSPAPERSETAPSQPAPVSVDGSAPKVKPPAPGAASELLRRLRVASVERLVRELSRSAPTTRAAVLAELRAAGSVKLYGDTLASRSD